ncbi:MG284/MPN403 family protein [Mycoplasma sp. 1573]
MKRGIESNSHSSELSLSEHRKQIREYCAFLKLKYHDEIVKNRRNFIESAKNKASLKTRYKTYVAIIDYFSQTLSEIDRLIFFNEFWEVNEDQFWFLDYFSKSTYYRRIKSVINSSWRYFGHSNL